jgi:hypothetical protein
MHVDETLQTHYLRMRYLFSASSSSELIHQ